MTFRVGQRVVCIDASDDRRAAFGWFGDVPVKGSIYTVARFGEVNAYGTREGALWLEEIRNGAYDGAYASRRFRPVIERKTDISIFQKMLTPSEVERAKRETV